MQQTVNQKTRVGYGFSESGRYIELNGQLDRGSDIVKQYKMLFIS